MTTHTNSGSALQTTIYVVFLHGLNGAPLGGGRSRRGEYLTRWEAEQHLRRLGSDGVIVTERVDAADPIQMTPTD